MWRHKINLLVVPSAAFDADDCPATLEKYLAQAAQDRHPRQYRLGSPPSYRLDFSGSTIAWVSFTNAEKPCRHAAPHP
jgi:hypothetical protein